MCISWRRTIHGQNGRSLRTSRFPCWPSPFSTAPAPGRGRGRRSASPHGAISPFSAGLPRSSWLCNRRSSRSPTTSSSCMRSSTCCSAAPQAALLRGLPEWTRRHIVAPFFASRPLRLLGIFRQPVVATVLFVGTTYFWMIPRFYDLALLDEPVHYIWHLTLLLSGLLFFWCLLDPRPYPYGASLGARLFMLWLGSMGHVLLGAFLSFKTVALYHDYDELGRWWAVSPVTDEQLGGLTMWVPGCMMIAFAGLLMIFRRLRQEERSAARAAPITDAAEFLARRRAANRALALGLLAFAGSGLLIALVSALAYHYSAAFSAS